MKVLFCTPCYDGKLVVEFERSMDATRRICHEAGVQTDWRRISGDCYVHKARDILAADFLASDCTDAFLIDADMGWDVMAPLRMLARPFEFVCGVYPYKDDKEGYPAACRRGPDGKLVFDRDTGCISMTDAPTGFWRLRRSVFEKMRPFADPYHSQGRDLLNFFKTPVIDGVFYGEDTAFCKYWTIMGGKIWCEPDIDFEHIGRKIWKGNYGNFLRRSQDADAEYASWLSSNETRQAA